MNKLNGFQRFKLTRLWYEKYSELDKEAFIKRACTEKGIEYTPPIKISRDIQKTVEPNMFPVKK